VLLATTVRMRELGRRPGVTARTWVPRGAASALLLARGAVPVVLADRRLYSRTRTTGRVEQCVETRGSGSTTELGGADLPLGGAGRRHPRCIFGIHKWWWISGRRWLKLGERDDMWVSARVPIRKKKISCEKRF
jgi:hypothetical protein